jgi:hypothetical protein
MEANCIKGSYTPPPPPSSLSHQFPSILFNDDILTRPPRLNFPVAAAPHRHRLPLLLQQLIRDHVLVSDDVMTDVHRPTHSQT